MAEYKRVMCRFIVEIPVSVPADWDKDSIEFRYNESTWCASNLVDMLAELYPPNKAAGFDEADHVGCFCAACKCEYIRDLPEE